MSDPSTVWADESYSLSDAYVHLISHSTRVSQQTELAGRQFRTG